MAKRIYWVSEKMAERAAKQGEVAAAKTSAKKWWNYGTCTMDQLLKAHTKDPVTSALANDIQDCALCSYRSRYSQHCDSCILPRVYPDELSCSGVYLDADLLLDDFMDRGTTITKFRKFQQKARKLARMLDRCVRVLERK